MALRNIGLFVLRVMFLAYFVVDGLDDLQNSSLRAKELVKDHATLDGHFKQLSGKHLPSYLSTSFVSKHSLQIIQISIYAQLTLAFLALLAPGLTPLVALLELVETLIAHNVLKFALASHPLSESEPILLALALFAASFLFCCSGKTQESQSKRRSEKSSNETRENRETREEKVQEKSKSKKH